MKRTVGVWSREPLDVALLVGACAALAPWAGLAADHAACYAALEKGSTALLQGRLDDAEAAFAGALDIAACREPPVGPLLDFSMGRVLLTLAESSPASACDAVEHLERAAAAENRVVADGAAALLIDARRLCLEYEAATDWRRPTAAARVDAPDAGGAPVVEEAPPTPPEPRVGEKVADTAPAPDADASTADTAEPVPPPGSWSFGPRLEGGVSGLWGADPTDLVSPGVTVGLGMVVERRAPGGSLALLVEPSVTATTINFRQGYAHDDLGVQSGTWLRTIVEATVAGAWFPGVGDLALRIGLRGGWVVDAVERSDVAGGTGWVDVDMASVAVDGVVGASYDWALGAARLRLAIDGGTGLARINVPADAEALDYLDHFEGWFGYRCGLAVSALF